MPSNRQKRKRDLIWERYITRTSRSAAPQWCHDCNQYHPEGGVKVPPRIPGTQPDLVTVLLATVSEVAQ